MNRACFPKETHQNSQKWAKFMNFPFCPFLWFGFPGRLLIFRVLKTGFFFGVPVCFQGTKKTHKHKQICPIVPGLGGCQTICLCFFFFSFLMGEKEAQKQKSPKNPGTIPSKFCFCFFSLRVCVCVFFFFFQCLVPIWVPPTLEALFFEVWS